MNDFVSVLNNKYHEQNITYTSNFKDQLLIVMGAIGRVSDIKITAPSVELKTQNSERVNGIHPDKTKNNDNSYDSKVSIASTNHQSDLNLPLSQAKQMTYLEEIVKTSRCRMRQVNLTGKWWHQENGALLTWIESEDIPVALLPDKKHKYLVFNPQTQTYSPINSTIATTLSTLAVMFYRPLPAVINNAIEVFLFSLKGYQSDLGKIILLGIVATVI